MIIDFDEYFKNYIYEPIDLCACYEPTFEPHTDFIAHEPISVKVNEQEH